MIPAAALRIRGVEEEGITNVENTSRVTKTNIHNYIGIEDNRKNPTLLGNEEGF